MSTEDGAEVATEEVPKLTEEKPAKEKKAKVPKSPKDKKRTGSKPSAPSHPPYFQVRRKFSPFWAFVLRFDATCVQDSILSFCRLIR